MDIQCPACHFVVSPAAAAQTGDNCPLCDRPLRDQPSPTASEFEMRNMPAPGENDMGGNPLQEGILADGGFQNRQKRDESFASVRTAEFALPGQEEAPGLGFDTAFPSHNFIVTGDGSVFSKPHPSTHEEIAQTLGDTEGHLNNGALGQLFSNGTTNWFSNGTQLSPQELQEAASAHFGLPVEVDPNHPGLTAQSQEDRFGWQGFHPRMEDEQSALRERTLPGHEPRPFGYYDNPFVNRGGKTADALPMETEAIALPGHTTFDATPSEWGLHGQVVGALGQLGAYVNGRQVDPKGDPEYASYLTTHWSGVQPPEDQSTWEWPENQGRSVMVSHPDPERADVARQVVEAGNSSPLQEYAQRKEAAHPASVQIPNGITDNLHTALGNLRAWVENPYENGQLRPYYNRYHKIIRPELHQRAGNGAIRIGVQDPHMAEIINHVAQTDDLTPLYEYRGVKQTKTAGPAAAIPAAAEAIGIGGAEAAGGAAAAGGAGAAGAGAAGAGGAGLAGGLGGKLMQGTAFGLGSHAVGGLMNNVLGAGGGAAAGPPPAEVHDPSYYARTSADFESPSSHPEAPTNEDGDSNQKDVDDNHEWQKDYDVNGIGGADSAVSQFPEFDPNGSAGQRLTLLAPLLHQFLDSPESGAMDPMIQALDQALEAEIPGYKEHGDDNAGRELIMMLVGPKGQDDEGEGEIEGEPTEIHEDPEAESDDEEEKPQKEARVDFLPSLPTLEGPRFERTALTPPTPGTIGPGPAPGLAPATPQQPLQTTQGRCMHCGATVDPSNGTCPQCGAASQGMPGHQNQQPVAKVADALPNSFMYEHTDVPPEMTLDEYRRTNPQPGVPCEHCGQDTTGYDVCPKCKTPARPFLASSHQGPHTPEQISAVQQFLIDQGRVDEVPDVPLYPENYSDILAMITGGDDPPQPADDGMGGQPEPPIEEAPPGDTMPVPGMSVPQQMTAAVERYAADSVAHKCPHCDSHTTRLTNSETGESQCHGCGKDFKSNVKPVEVKTALEHHRHVEDPTADEQALPEDIEKEQDTAHTWADSDGQPLKVGQYYELYSERYDIPDLIRVEQVKPESIVYTLMGDKGLDAQTELTKEEADLMGNSFVPSPAGPDGELQPEGVEVNNDDNTSYEGSPETTDMSTPHALVSSNREWLFEGSVQETPEGDTGREWLLDGQRTAGRAYTPWEQREFIDEAGTARNADKLDLTGTHYEEASDDTFLFGL